MRNKIRFLTAAAGLVLLAACDNDPDVVIVDPGDPPGQPTDLFATYAWVLEDFDNGQPVGYPSVQVTWFPPAQWDDEVFRVYAKRVSAASFTLIATVTSCTTAGCVYTDRNVAYGQEYEYYVAAYDESSDQETSSDFRDVVRIPANQRPATPTGLASANLDNAVFLQWQPNGANGENVSRYLIYLTRLDNQTTLYRVGETDGTGFLDQRAENGSRFGYRVATVDTMGHVSNLSAEVVGVPRPDFTGELVYAFADSALASGFRFQSDEATNPILPGNSASAQWRLESDASGYRIVPMNGTQVTEWGRTTALVCGPGADASCTAARVAPSAGYTTAPIPVDAEYSYVFRVTGSDGQPHYAVLRVTMLGTDQNGKDLMIFDWAYQTVPNEPQLERRAN
ncbi:MAG TPA: hypothetical protein VHG08_01330 [Longimicrobium sp.]|nr:hypothetical protein [Longimicrobium sp.]